MLRKFFLNERNMMAAIVLNAVIIFFLYFPQYEHIQWLDILDHVFIAIFLLEAVFKIQEFGWKGYMSDSWNVFDFIIVALSMPSLLTYFVDLPNTSVLLILRLFRLIRLVRFIKFVPHMSMIMAGLARALRASLFVIAALFFLNFMLALFTCHFYGDIVPQYFGDPMISSYTIFQLFTVEGWNEIPSTIAEKMDNRWLVGIMRIYFVLVVLLGGIFGMSLANAVFVDEMTMDNNQDLEVKIDELNEKISELQQFLKNKAE